MKPGELMAKVLATKGLHNPNAAAEAIAAAGHSKKGALQAALQAALRRFIDLGSPLRQSTMTPICDFLQIDPSVFASEAAATAEAARRGYIPKELANVELAQPPRNDRKYPVISSVQAGEWREIVENFRQDDVNEWLPSMYDLGPNGYCLRVRGISMRDKSEGATYSFNEGLVLHVNPDLTPVPGQFVIVRREGTKEATFKRYVILDGEHYLMALSPDWPTRYLKLEPDDVSSGVVKGSTMANLP